MFTKEKQKEIFDKIIKATKEPIRKEMNRSARKLRNTYLSMMYSPTEPLLEKAEISIDSNLKLNIDLKLNSNIPFEGTDKQNIVMTIERGGGFLVKDSKPATVGSNPIRNIMGIKL